MHTEIEDEFIDESQWLPKGEAVYTSARLAKGDLRVGRDGQARFTALSIMTTLRDFDVLDDSHLEAADTFDRWRKTLAHVLRLDGMRASTSGASDECKEDNYIMLVKRMHSTDLRIVTEAYDKSGVQIAQRLRYLKAKDTKAYSAALRSLRNTYRDAFDELEKNVDELK